MTQYRHAMALLLALAGLAPAAVTAQEIQTACANLPEQGIIATRTGPEVDVPPTRSNGQWVCQAGYRLVAGPPPRCRGASAVPVFGNPRAFCYANMPFSLNRYASVTSYNRPIADTCPAPQPVGLLLRGANIGYTDVTISAVTRSGTPAPGMTVLARRASGPQVPAHDDPALNLCPAYACVRLTVSVALGAPDLAAIRFALPGGRHVDHPIATAPKCPPPRRANRCSGANRPGASAPGSAYACSPA